MTSADLVGLGQFGFAAAMAYLIWKSYTELVPQLLQIIRQNSEAIEKFAALLLAHTKSIDGMRESITLLDSRMERVESQGIQPHSHMESRGKV